jgi:malate dehydrogenase (oxaloacetate-decarboxylating)(NADP+)
VGEACQKFGKMPFYPRGCYVSITDRGNIKKVLEDYAAVMCEKGADGKYLCDCIVFSDGGRILGLGDLGSWGMGIPIGKLDLYTVCAGVNPYRTIPVIIDAGCYDKDGNTDKVLVRDSELYTGLKQDRVTHKSAAGTVVNSAYYGEGNMIEEFLQAAADVFGKNCLCQFEDFNSNDAFPLLAEYREKFLTYNDDIQGTASVAVAGLLGAVKLKKPECTDLISELKKEVFLFHGAGSANIGALLLLANEAGVPRDQLYVTNSRGVIWKSADGSEGSFRNDEQKEFATVGKPAFDGKNLVEVVKNLKPTSIIGAVGRDPGCFNKDVVDAMLEVNGENRPGIYALSNPKTQAEITSTDCWKWSNGKAIYGSGTGMETVELNGKKFCPGQVNNVYIFPGMSMAAVCCKASTIPERLFMVAAEAVANSLDAEDLAEDRCVPHPDKIRHVGLNVATAVVMEAQKMGLAGQPLGTDAAEVKAALEKLMWAPTAVPTAASPDLAKVPAVPAPTAATLVGA